MVSVLKRVTAAATAAIALFAATPTANAVMGGRTNESTSIARVILGDRLCTGTVIAPTKVLTAKHCVHQGANQVVVGNRTLRVTEATLHPSADLAVVTLNRPTGVTPAPISGAHLRSGARGIATGWGGDDRRLNPISRAEQADVRVVRRVTNLPSDDPRATLIEATLTGGRAQPGDSGGPLLQGRYVTGVMSMSSKIGTGAFYTPVAEHADWIARHGGSNRPAITGTPMPVVDATRFPTRLPAPQSPIVNISEIESLLNYRFNVTVLSS